MSQAPATNPSGPAEAGVPYSTKEWITPTFLQALRIWWAYYWPTTLVSGAFTFLLAIAVAALSRQGKLDPITGMWTLRLAPYLSGAVVGLFVFQYLLTTRFGSFRIAIFPATYNADQLSIPPTFAHGLRIWWTLTWRSVVFSLIGAFVVSIPAGALVGTMAAMSPVAARIAQLFVTLAIGAGVGLYVIYSSILDEEFGTFSVRLVPRNPGPPPQRVEAVATGAVPATE